MSGIDHACQSGRHSLAERGLDLYETPAVAVEALLLAETLPLTIWEPAAGRGAIARVLRACGHTVVTSDIGDHGFPLDFVADFLTTVLSPKGCGAIVTNPPYQIATEFARHALDLAPRVCLLLRLAFLESVRRTEILERRGLVCVHVFRRRLPCTAMAGMAHAHRRRFLSDGLSGIATTAAPPSSTESDRRSRDSSASSRSAGFHRL
jgi:hypothetical protein